VLPYSYRHHQQGGSDQGKELCVTPLSLALQKSRHRTLFAHSFHVCQKGTTNVS
jgi:hypothetical protein